MTEEKEYKIYGLHPKGKDFTPAQTYVCKTSLSFERRLCNHMHDSKMWDSKVACFLKGKDPDDLEMELLEVVGSPTEASFLESYYWQLLGPGLDTQEPSSWLLLGDNFSYNKRWHRNNWERDKARRG